MPLQTESVTTLLRQWSSGDLTARDKVIPLIYDQLHKLAAGRMRGEGPGHTLKATALVHEAYLRLVNSDLDIEDGVQFFSVCASLMRRLPLAKSSCAKIRNVMSVLFNHACRYELFDRTPIRLVRQGAKRKTAPNVLTPGEIKTLVDGLELREKTLVLLAASTGLRQSELFGLKWGDINFGDKTIYVTRSIVYGVVGPCKTEASQRPVPVHPLIIETLLKWREQ
jgi:integrase